MRFTLRALRLIPLLIGFGVLALGAAAQTDIGPNGDGGPATLAKLVPPRWVAADPAGNVYFSDFDNNRVRRVGTDGVIRTFAGTGTPGAAGDGGPALAAQLTSPTDLAVDATGTLFVVVGNGRIRKVTPDGVIRSLLFRAEALATDSAGAVYFAAGGPTAVADLYIRKLTADGVLTTVAGNGARGAVIDGAHALSTPLNPPNSIAVDADGDLYFADRFDPHVIKVGRDGFVRKIIGIGVSGFAGDGNPARSARIDPMAIAVDADGNVYIGGTGRVRKVSRDGIIRTIAGTGERGMGGEGGPAIAARFTPFDLAIDAAGDIFIADQSNARIWKVTANGVIVTVAGCGPPPPPISVPGGIATRSGAQATPVTTPTPRPTPIAPLPPVPPRPEAGRCEPGKFPEF